MNRPDTQPAIPPSTRPPRIDRRSWISRRTVLIGITLVVGLIIVVTVVPIRRKVYSSGELFTKRKAELRPSVEGVVGRSLAFSGQDVAEGQLIIQLKDELQRAAYEQSASELKAKQAQLDQLVTSQELSRAEREQRIAQAELTLKLHRSRYNHMVKAGMVGGSFSPNEIDEAKLRVDLARADLAVLQLSRDDVMDKQIAVLTEEIAAAGKLVVLHETEMQLRRIAAPLAGTIELEQLQTGEVVNPKDVLGHIYDTSAWIVRLKVNERYSQNIEEDQPVRVEIAGCPPVRYGYLGGHVSWVRPLVTSLPTGDGVFVVHVTIDTIPPDYRKLFVKSTAWGRIDAGRTTWLFHLLGW